MTFTRFVLLGIGYLAAAFAQAAEPRPADATRKADPLALAARIDHLVSARWRERGVQPAGLADDAEFFRRISLDITGRIPRSRDVYDFLADRSPDKRHREIDRLLESPRHVQHFAEVWRALLLSEIAANPQARFFQQGFEAWLGERLRADMGYDRLVYELLTTPIAGTSASGQSVLSRPDQPNPLAFFAVKDGSPDKIAAAATRLFLGVQLECAQCHNHPFARWRRDQFWSQAAFFAGIERQGEGIFRPLTEDVSRRSITVAGSDKVVPAVFLDEAKPAFPTGKSPREALAAWITAPENKLFARAAVNRVWARFFGTGLVEPVDDFHDENLPSHPELLDLLAQSFVASGFDLRYLMRAICNSQTYQRTSAMSHPSQNEPRLFARMAVKDLSGEQFFDSLALAVGYRDAEPVGGSFQGARDSPRNTFLTRFASQGSRADGQTSVLQALTLMNGRFLAGALKLDESTNLASIAHMPRADTSQRIEAVYFLALGRPPTASEQTRLASYVQADKEGEWLADLFWVLLNSAEFRFNH